MLELAVVLPSLRHMTEVKPKVVLAGFGDDELDNLKALLAVEVHETLGRQVPHEGRQFVVRRFVLQDDDSAAQGSGQRIAPHRDVGDGDDGPDERNLKILVLGLVRNVAGLAGSAIQAARRISMAWSLLKSEVMSSRTMTCSRCSSMVQKRPQGDMRAFLQMLGHSSRPSSSMTV